MIIKGLLIIVVMHHLMETRLITIDYWKFLKGFTEGYLTMDAIAAIAFQ